MRNPVFVVTFVTVYLVLFTILSRLNVALSIMLLLFSLSPIFMLWMVYIVLKYGNYSGRELEEDEEWGYQDYL